MYVTFLYKESECVIVKYFKIRLIFLMSQRLVKIKPESGISCHISILPAVKYFAIITLLTCAISIVNNGERVGSSK